jgi:hypothetical protein
MVLPKQERLRVSELPPAHGRLPRYRDFAGYLSDIADSTASEIANFAIGR